MKQTFEIPEGCNRVTIEQHGRQIITTFEPEFKDGDFIYCKDMAYEYVFIFKSLSDNKNNPFWCYVSFGLNDESDYNIDYNIKVRGSEDIIRIATKSEQQQLIDALAKEGKQWNAEKKCIEDIKPKRWRAEKGVYYWYLDTCIETSKAADSGLFYDELRYLQGNYFQTEKQAFEAAEKIKELLKQINP